MKKFFWLFVVAFLVFSCSSMHGHRRVTITFMGWGDEIEAKLFSSLLADFEKKYPDIKVKYVVYPPSSYREKLATVVASGEAPDVFYIHDVDFGSYVTKGVLKDLDPFIENSTVIDLDDIWPQAIWRYRFDGFKRGSGPVYALPKDLGPVVMFYNKELFDRFGVPYPDPEVPWTWDEAVANWKKLTRDTDGDGTPDYWGVLHFPYEAAVWSNGGRIADPAKGLFVMHKSPEAIEAVRWILDLSFKYRVHPLYSHIQSYGVQNLFETGRVATYFTGRWMVPKYRQLSFDWDVAPIPVSPKTHKKAGWSGSVGFAMYASTKHPYEAWKLIEFLAGPEGQRRLAESGFQVPNQISLARTDVFLQRGRRPEHAEVFLDAAMYEKPQPPAQFPISNEWYEKVFWQECMSRVWLGEVDPAKAIAEIAPRVQKTMDEAYRAAGIDIWRYR